MPSTQPRILTRCSAVLALSLAAAFGMTGCALDFTPQEQPAAPTGPTAGTPTAQTPAAQTDAVETETAAGDGELPDSPDAEAGDDGSTSTVPTLAEVAGMATTTLSCDNGSVTVADAGSIVELSSDCESVEVSGTGAILLANDISTLTVTADGAVVYASEIGSVQVSGDGSYVSWETGTPSQSDTGTGNVLMGQP